MDSHQSKTNPFDNIKVSGVVTAAPAQTSDTPAAHQPSPAEEWELNKAAIRHHGRAGNWAEALKLLKAMSVKHRNKEMYMALAQRCWVALKSDAPGAEVVLALFHLLSTLTPRHEIAGPIAALAHLMAKHRTPDHPDRDLALGQAQQMLSLVCDQSKVVGEEAFAIWVKHNRLDDPDHYVPIVMAGLEMMVGDNWWFDRQALQADLDAARNSAAG